MSLGSVPRADSPLHQTFAEVDSDGSSTGAFAGQHFSWALSVAVELMFSAFSFR